MQAVVLRAFGDADNLKPEIVPDPTPGHGEVLLQVKACASTTSSTGAATYPGRRCRRSSATRRPARSSRSATA